MPIAKDTIDVCGTNVPIEIEFELWCDICGHGICHTTTYKRGTVNNFLTYCDNCQSSYEELESERNTLQMEVERLTDEITSLEYQVSDLEEELDKYK